jgi:hypothetical protein
MRWDLDVVSVRSRLLTFQGNDAERYRPPIPPQAHCVMKLPCEWKTTIPKIRDGGEIGGQVFAEVLMF